MAWWSPWDNWDGDDLYDEDEEAYSVVCKFCGKGGLQWQTDCHSYPEKPRFFLVDAKNRAHNCRAATPTEFEDYSNVVPKTSSTTAGSRPDNRPGSPANTRKQAKIRASRIAKPRAKRARCSSSQTR